jgi:hypothetical protein
MANQFNGYCYSTLAEAANADLASPVAAASGLVSPAAYVVTSSNTVDMTYLFQPFASGSTASYTISRFYPDCAAVGQLNNNSGITVEDAVFTSWSIIAAWAVVYWFKLGKMGARGY